MDGVTMVMVISVVTVACTAGVLKHWIDYKKNAGETQLDETVINELRLEVTQLSERVRILEKLATDSDHHLREEISRLA